MVVWHVTSARKLAKYQAAGFIAPPVRAWELIQDAERMSLSSGRRVIVRLRFPDSAPKLEGHFGRARVCHQQIRVESL